MPGRDLAGRRLLAVAEEELQRIVLDVHDGPVQNLFAALSQLAVARARLASAEVPPEALAPLARAAQLLESSLDGIRLVLSPLHAPRFAERPVAAIIEELAAQHEELTDTPVTLDLPPDLPDVPLSVKIALFRVVQEALSNIRRHAGIGDARVCVRRRGRRLHLEIHDRGRGFEPPPLTGPQATEEEDHIGLRGMRERVALVGGTLAVESQPGAGTRVRVRIPVDG